ncbi:CAP domain-containing protein, partial [Peptacetobacter sp.]|uniref:CAP domain-containing protein n=1 Tax=Peptacetobacter sp. TaxID=2991975 RepID=UPI00261D2D90
KSVMNNKDKVQVGGMKDSIVDSVFSNNPAPKPEPGEKPNKPEEKPNKPEEKPTPDPAPSPAPKPDPNPAPAPKPDEKTYDINSPEFQSIVRKEFYRLLDAHRAANGVVPIKHHWACEESSMIKSKDMIDKGYFGHYDKLKFPHVYCGGENIAGQWVLSAVTEQEGKDLANRLFNQWKKSPGHNEIMLYDTNDFINNDTDIDGFSFYAKESYYGESFGGHLQRSKNKVYMIKATYHHSSTHGLVNTPETTNPASPGYQGK